MFVKLIAFCWKEYLAGDQKSGQSRESELINDINLCTSAHRPKGTQKIYRHVKTYT